MTFLSHMKQALLVALIFSFTASLNAANTCACTEEDIKREISYLSKKLLELKGEKQYVLTNPVYQRPYIGICFSGTKEGMLLTCVTPGHQAFKAGLKTGDVITHVNGVSLANSDPAIVKKNYLSQTKNIQTGDVLAVQYIRTGENFQLDLTVGQLAHPAYKLEINMPQEPDSL